MTETTALMNSRKSASPLGHALVLMGDSWTIGIVRSIFLGRRRFRDMRDMLQISDAVLSVRLSRLVADGILRKQIYQERPARYEYLLTDAGVGMWQILVALWSWDVTWSGEDQAAARAQLRHIPCGNTMLPVFGCGRCGSIGLSARDVRGSIDRRALMDATQRRSRRSPTTSEKYNSSNVLGDHWSITILSAAFLGSRHFNEFQTRLQVSPVTLNDRLILFVEAGMMSRESFTKGAKRQIYRLTPKGRDFFKVTAMINAWAQAWLSDDGSSGLSLIHDACGHELQPQLTCNNCNAPLRREEIAFEGTSADLDLLSI